MFQKSHPQRKNLLSLPIPILQTSIFRYNVFVLNGIHADLEPGIDELDQNLRVLVVTGDGATERSIGGRKG